jgi:hypothetical protein
MTRIIQLVLGGVAAGAALGAFEPRQWNGATGEPRVSGFVILSSAQVDMVAGRRMRTCPGG